MSPTPIGERIVAQARTILQEINNLVALAEQGKDPLGSVLSVGAIFTVGPYLFPKLVPRIKQLAPDMPMYIEESYTADLRVKLSRGALDAIFVALPFTEPEVVTRPLFDEPFVVLLREDHELASASTIKPAELAKHKVLLMGEGHCFRDQVLEACPGLQQSIAEHNSRDHAVVEGSSLETLKHMVASGMGITVLPESAASTALYSNGDLVVRPFSDPVPFRTIVLAWRVSYPRHQAIDMLARALKD